MAGRARSATTRPSTSCFAAKDVDARDKPGHDDEMRCTVLLAKMKITLTYFYEMYRQAASLLAEGRSAERN